MALLKNKILILVLFVVFLILVGGLAFKVFSIYAFNSTTKELETGNHKLFNGFKDEISASNKIDVDLVKATEALSNTRSFSKEKVTQYINQAKTEYNDSFTTYKSSLDELETSVSKLDSFSKMPLWLGTDQKRFIDDITTSLDNYKSAQKADYAFMVQSKPITSNFLQITDDTAALVSYTLPLNSATSQQEAAAALVQNFSLLAPLEKYSNASYKFDGQDTLAKEYPNSYKTFEAFKSVFGGYYLAFKGLTQGDTSQVGKLQQLGVEFENSANALEQPISELNTKEKSSITKIRDAYASYAKALDFYSEKKLYSNLLSKTKRLAQNNQNKAVVVAYATQLYENDKNKPPADPSFSALIATLKSGNYFDSSLKYNEADFAYTSDGVTYYDIGYKDEVTGTVEKVLIGAKETANQTLGASTQTVKINDIDVNLGAASALVSYINSLTH